MTWSSSALVCGLSGLISGVMYRHNILYVRHLIRVPKWVASVANKLLGRLICSPPPAEPTIQMGATLELQREQQMELIEQQMIFSRFRQFNPNNGLDSAVRPTNDLNGRTGSHLAHPSTSTNAQHVTALVEMGFDRQNVVRALQRSNNDMTLATNILLSES